MFHSLTTGSKQQNDPSQPQPTTEQEQILSPHLLLVAGQLGLGGAGTVPPGSFIAAQPQLARLHRTYGNQAVLRMLSRSAPSIQTKLTVNKPGDEYEQEADRVADHVMRMADAPIMQKKCSACEAEKLQTKCAACEEGEKKEIRRKETAASAEGAPPIVHDVLRSPGRPLDPAARAFMEPRFGVDFSQVRVHDDRPASESARSVNALAYTVGADIVFRVGQYAPQTIAGRYLLSHELAHVVQQSHDNLQPRREIGEGATASQQQPGGAVPRVSGLRSLTPGTSRPVALQRTCGADLGRRHRTVSRAMRVSSERSSCLS